LLVFLLFLKTTKLKIFNQKKIFISIYVKTGIKFKTKTTTKTKTKTKIKTKIEVKKLEIIIKKKLNYIIKFSK